MTGRTAAVTFHKVKGHATEQEVATGLVDAIDKFGNDGADALAREGAALHPAPQDSIQQALYQKSAAMNLQAMMVEILAARRAAEAASVELDDAVEPEHELVAIDSEACQPSVPATAFAFHAPCGIG